jgi:endonuclease YncB( thermonuclease family)
MPFTLIKGTFSPNIGIPDGDSVRFRADDLSLWERLDGRRANPSSTNKTVQLRFEGIDSIEKDAIQPLARQSRDSMLELIGATLQTTSRGYVLSRSTDDNGRPIVFPFAGNAPEPDGASIFLGAARVRDSVNFGQVRAGFAYPLYYNTLFREIRETLNEALDEARNAGRGYWPTDATLTGVTIAKRNQLDEIPPIWPKLWRRLDEFLKDNEGLDGFLEFIRAKGERADDLTTFEQRSLDNFMVVNGNNIRMNIDPRNLRVVSVLT